MAKGDKTRQLTVEQLNAIDLLVQGKSDRETAEAVGVARQTVTEWRNGNPAFMAELNRRRQEVWGAQVERLRNLVGQAVTVLEEHLASSDPRLRQAAALHILRAVGLYGTDLRPTGPVEPEDVAAELEGQEQNRKLLRMLAG